MFRGIAWRIAQRRFVTVHSAPEPTGKQLNEKSIWGADLRHPTKVPQNPVKGSNCAIENTPPEKEATPIVLSEQTVRLLERLSLVNLDSKEAYRTLQDSIEFASRILPIDTNGVEPLYCVLEQRKLSLRPDTVDDGDLQEEVLKNAALTEEEYFVAPLGNIPLEQS